MKSDEEFIAGIYAKAEAYQAEQTKREDNNVIHITSFQQRIKRVSKYAAGVAACLACGIAVYLGTNINKGVNNGNSILKERKARDNESVQPMTIEANLEIEGRISEQENHSQQIQCTILEITEQDGIDHIDAIVESGDHVMLLVPKENKSKLIEVGNELVLSVKEVDTLGNYSIQINQEVYLYSGMENGEKVFTSENQSVLRERDLKPVE